MNQTIHANSQESIVNELLKNNGQYMETTSGTIIGNTTSGLSQGSYTNNFGTYYTYPYYYPYQVVYTPAPESKFTFKVTKAENGFVIDYNGKLFVAKNELEVAKVIVKNSKEGE